MDDKNPEFKRALKSAFNILSKRSHSHSELKQKLSLKYSKPTVNKVLKKIQENNWLESEDNLSKQITESLHLKKKSWHYIKNYLEKKNLLLPEYNRKKELEKSHDLLLQKNFKDQQKAKRFLFYKGFERDIIEEVLQIQKEKNDF